MWAWVWVWAAVCACVEVCVEDALPAGCRHVRAQATSTAPSVLCVYVCVRVCLCLCVYTCVCMCVRTLAALVDFHLQSTQEPTNKHK